MQTLTPTTVDEVFAAFQDAPSNSEKGTAFEKLMVEYFQLDPALSMKYEHVSRWIDWAHRGPSVDVGIDLVARDRDEGSWTAIQCKFFNPDHYLSKGDIDSFFTASGKTYEGVGFTNRIIISTTDHWSEEAHLYQLGSRSALEWIIDRYWIRTDKASGIVNDPNAWSQEHEDPANSSTW